MTGHNLRIWGLLQAEIATVEGMKAENQLREHCDQSPAYSDHDFEYHANEMRRLAEAFEPFPVS